MFLIEELECDLAPLSLYFSTIPLRSEAYSPGDNQVFSSQFLAVKNGCTVSFAAFVIGVALVFLATAVPAVCEREDE